MSRETEMHFANIPETNISRSKMERPHQEWTTFNAGDLIPIYVDSDIMPGDTVKMKMSSVIRMMTPLVPVLDNCYYDVTFFFVPHRLVWDHWVNFWGQNDTAPWVNQVDYYTPKIVTPENGGWTEKSLADYLGYPLHVENKVVNALPARAYIKIWNDWWRDQNWKNPIYLNTSDDRDQGYNLSDFDPDENPWDPTVYMISCAAPAKAAKFHDYFTSVLPSVQKGPDVYLPLGDTANVVARNNPSITPPNYTFPEEADNEQVALGRSSTAFGLWYESDTAAAGYKSLGTNEVVGLYADLSNAVGATIVQLRQAYAIQSFYEALARGGSRYTEMIRSIYGVTNPDFRMQRAEYLGGFRCPINISQVIQSDAGATDATPLGHTGAYSVTADNRDDLFTHSFTEHGTLMGLITVRHDLSYSQGLNRMFTRDKLFDYYTPQLANLSEQPVYNYEIYCDSTDEKDNEAWGYQEAWADYRYFPNQVKGEFRETYAQSLGVWTYQDYYTERPTMGDKWIDADDSAIQRTLAVQNHNQFYANFYFKPTYIRPMPIYSIPGLRGHM